MADERPWRTVIISGDTGRFTREQIRAAVEFVIARRDARKWWRRGMRRIPDARPAVRARSADVGSPHVRRAEAV